MGLSVHPVAFSNPMITLLSALVAPLLLLSSQASQHPAKPQIVKPSVAVDTAFRRADSLARVAERRYVELLERANSELSMRYNPYGIAVSALAVLFTVGAIVVGYTIFRQGSDYRNLITNSIAEYQTILNGFIAEKNQQMKAIQETLATQVKVLEKNLETATAAQKTEIEKEIKALKDAGAALKPTAAPKPLGFPSAGISPSTAAAIGRALATPTFSLGPMATGMGKEVVCSRCNTRFNVPFRGLLTRHEPVQCPSCGQQIKIKE